MKTIVWDVDEVLNNFIQQWLLWIGKIRPDCKIDFNDVDQYDLTQVLPLNKVELGDHIDRFKFEGRYLTLNPDKKVYDWFCGYGDYFNNVVLTSPSLQTSHITAEWVFRNYGKWIRGFNVIPSFRKLAKESVFDIHKIDWLKRNPVDIYIEDNQQNYDDAIFHGIESYLVKKPWNNSNQTIEEILEILSSKA